jgi:bifunctional DNA-binding transcriptional regulator/antitoxin component of YhaV-PrlF toxin-antitoxin module
MVENLLTSVDADGAITIPPDLLREYGLAGGELTLELVDGKIRMGRRDPSDPRHMIDR